MGLDSAVHGGTGPRYLESSAVSTASWGRGGFTDRRKTLNREPGFFAVPAAAIRGSYPRPCLCPIINVKLGNLPPSHAQRPPPRGTQHGVSMDSEWEADYGNSGNGGRGNEGRLALWPRCGGQSTWWD